MTLLTSSQPVGLRLPQTPQKLEVYVSKGWELEMAQATPPLGSPIWIGVRLAPQEGAHSRVSLDGGPPPEQV